MSLLTGCVPQAVKVAVINLWIKRPLLIQMLLLITSYQTFISKTLEEAVANQLCDDWDRNDLLENLQSGFRTITETAVNSY